MKSTLRWSLPFLLLSGVACQEVAVSPEEPSFLDVNDPDGLVAGLGLAGPESLFVTDQADPVAFSAPGACLGLLCASPGDVLINKVTNQDQLQPSVATRSSDGLSLVVFTDKSQSTATPSNTSDIKGRFVNSAGVPQGNDFFINSGTAGGQDTPDVAVSGNTFLVVWRDSSTNPASIKGRRLQAGANGTPSFASADQTIQSVGAGFQLLQPAVASVSLGSEFVVVWTRTSSSDAGDIGAKRVDADGALGPVFGAAAFAGTQSDPDVVGDSFGNFLVAWTDNNNNTLAGSITDVRAQRFGLGAITGGGGGDFQVPLGGAFTINNNTNASQSQVALAASSADPENYYAAWNDANLTLGDNSISSIRGRLITESSLGLESQINTTTQNAQAQPAVSHEALTGDYVVAWVDDSHLSPDTSSTGIRVNRVNSEGVVRGTASAGSGDTLVNTTTKANGQTQVALPSVAFGGVIFATWADASPSTAAGFDGKGFGVRASHLVLGCDIDDGSVCTNDSCNGAVDIHTNLTDGTACEAGTIPFVAQVVAGSDICIAGECVESVCGDGFRDINKNEECDLGANNGDPGLNCSNNCRLVNVNETGLAREADFCDIQFPFTVTINSGESTQLIFGQIFEAGLTDQEPNVQAPGIIAELGFGPENSDPRSNLEWQFFTAQFNTPIPNGNPNNDEYRLSLTAPVVLVTTRLSYAYRFSLDGGESFTYCDKTNTPGGAPDVGSDGGAGSNIGLTFSPTELGLLIVEPNNIFIDNMESGANGWTSQRLSGSPDALPDWSQSTDEANSPTHSWNSTSLFNATDETDTTGDVRLVSPVIDLTSISPGTPILLSFRHLFVFDDCGEGEGFTADGGVVEVSQNNGAFVQVTPVGGYNGTIEDEADCSAPLVGAPAFVHNSNDQFVLSSVDLGSFAGSLVRVAFRTSWDCGNCIDEDGWYIDDVQVSVGVEE